MRAERRREMYYRNPYDRDKDPKNWHRWNIGEEDGSRGMPPQGRSVAYKDGYNAGAYYRLLANAFGARERDAEKGHSR